MYWRWCIDRVPEEPKGRGKGKGRGMRLRKGKRGLYRIAVGARSAPDVVSTVDTYTATYRTIIPYPAARPARRHTIRTFISSDSATFVMRGTMMNAYNPMDWIQPLPDALLMLQGRI